MSVIHGKFISPPQKFDIRILTLCCGVISSESNDKDEIAANASLYDCAAASLHMLSIVYYMTLALSLASIAYLLFACCAVAAFRTRRHRSAAHHPPITLLKPVCGAEPHLFDNLCSFCDQDYPEFQIIFGVRDASDPAIGVIQRVIDYFPERDVSLAIDGRTIGTNLKVSNLANSYATARHDLIVVADSDMRVGRHYLKAVVAPFDDPSVGAVTCLYTGAPLKGFASQLSAMFINDWFLPSVLVARNLQPLRYCFGATMAIRRKVLEAAGGFDVLASHLADDYMLGQRVSQLGFKVCLSPYVVENVVWEPSLKATYAHALRWARTVRSAQPLGFAFSFITDALPLAILFLFVSHFAVAGFAVLLVALMLRTGLHYLVHTAAIGVTGPAKPWLIPAQDLLRLAVWAASFLGSNVRWRDRNFAVSSSGQLAFKSVEKT